MHPFSFDVDYLKLKNALLSRAAGCVYCQGHAVYRRESLKYNRADPLRAVGQALKP